MGELTKLLGCGPVPVRELTRLVGLYALCELLLTLISFQELVWGGRAHSLGWKLSCLDPLPSSSALQAHLGETPIGSTHHFS